MLKVTEAAAENIKKLAAETADPESQMLRISFAGYG